MIRYIIARRSLFAIALTALAQAAAAQESTCPNHQSRRDPGEFPAALQARLKAQMETDIANVKGPQIPSAAETSATSGSNVADSVVSDAGLIKFASLVLGGDMIDSNSDTGTVTVTLNPFAAIAVHDSTTMTDQDKYEDYELLRRINGAVTVFGKGQSIDQDGDGKLDDARIAKDFDDVVSFEIRARLWGDRDRRAAKNFKAFTDATRAALRNEVTNYNKLMGDGGLRRYIAEKAAAGDDIMACGTDDDLDAAIAWTRTTTAGAATTLDFMADANDVLERVDNAWIGTLVAGGTARKDGFGSDEYMVGLRTSWGYQGRNFNANAEYTNVNAVQGLADMDKYKLGIEAEQRFDMLPGGNKSVLSFGFAYELVDGTPASANDETAKLSLKWKLPVTTEAAAIVSFTWANNTELLDGHDDVIGHVGLSFDYERAIDKMATHAH